MATLLHDLEDPPIAEIGAMSLDEYLPTRERHQLATALNTLLASPTFDSGAPGARSMSRSGSRRARTAG